eukprot:135218_1
MCLICLIVIWLLELEMEVETETIEELQERIESLEKENSALNKKVEALEDRLSYYETKTAEFEEPLLSQTSSKISEYLPPKSFNKNGKDDTDAVFYKRMFVLGLRSYVKADNM